MPTIVAVTLTLASVVLFIGALHIRYLRHRLDKAEFCYDIAVRALTLLSDPEIYTKINNLDRGKMMEAVVDMAKKQFEEDMEEDEDDE